MRSVDVSDVDSALDAGTDLRGRRKTGMLCRCLDVAAKLFERRKLSLRNVDADNDGRIQTMMLRSDDDFK